MEFSEITELGRVLKMTSFDKEKSAKICLAEKMIDYDANLHEELKHSPPCTIPNELCGSLPDEVPEWIIEPRKCSTEVEVSELQVQKVDNFKENYYESITKVSTLTQSLMEETSTQRDRRRSSDKTPNAIELLIYLFGTLDTLAISVPITTTIEQLIAKIIGIYLKSEVHKARPLPKGPVAEAYQIWLIDEEHCFPDTDFTIERNKTVKDLDTEKLAFCAISGSGFNKNVSVINDNEDIEGIPLKIFVEDTWVMIGADPKCHLRDVLLIIERKFPKLGYMNPVEYEFRIEVVMEDSIEKEECIVNMDLPVSSLSTEELRLYKKRYADTPAESLSVRKEIPLYREDEEARYDPSRFHISRAQACAYKEYEVVKINKKNKKQKRILGINQLRLFNMTEAQSKQAVKEKAIPESSKKIFKKKFASIFKSVTQHPEIPIENILSVQQDTKNLSCLSIEYFENGIKKRKHFETEKSSIAMEIVAKISKLITMVSSKFA